MKLPFVINEDDKTTFEPVITVTEITFQIDSKDNKKLRLDVFASSDLLYVVFGMYLIYTPLTGGTQTVIASPHRQNMNTLQSGIYVLKVQYYRERHYKDITDHLNH